MAGPKSDSATAAGSANVPSGNAAAGQPHSDMIYPSIRTLPILGVRWAELYQQVKIQETVYQLLTQEYELAKIQEAKEIPTVKVMDEAALPERKSFPPRLGFMALGALLGCLTGALWVLGVVFWQAIEPDDPAKAFTLDVLSTVKKWFKLRREHLQELSSKPPLAHPLQHSERGRAEE
jgi:hypothetical protein